MPIGGPALGGNCAVDKISNGNGELANPMGTEELLETGWMEAVLW